MNPALVVIAGAGAIAAGIMAAMFSRYVIDRLADQGKHIDVEAEA